MTAVPPRAWRPADLAERFGVRIRAVYRAIARGDLRAARIGQQLRIHDREARRWGKAAAVGDADGVR